MMISEADKAILIVQDDLTLAQWWCELNNWRWPAGLPNPEPGLESSAKLKSPRRGDIMEWITDMIGLELALRVWNKDSMTDQEFSDFWNRSRDPEARKRHQQYMDRRRAEFESRNKEEKKP